MYKRTIQLALICSLIFILSCQKTSVATEVIKTFPMDNMDQIITKSNVTFDSGVSSDGKGSIRIDASEPVTIRLFEIKNINIDEARLIYRARLKSENVTGQAYLEMWCVFPGLGEYFSRALQSPLSGTVDWTTQETPFFLQKGQKPELVKLNVVINGQGTVWVDDVSLIKGPLK